MTDQPKDPKVIPFGKPVKRSKGWAVVREQAPVMPWEDGEPMEPLLADTLRRISAVSGTALVLHFYLDVMELQDRLEQARGDGEPLVHAEAEAVIHQHYHELVELNGLWYAQRFVRIWLLCSDFTVARDKRVATRAALKKQLARVLVR